MSNKQLGCPYYALKWECWTFAIFFFWLCFSITSAFDDANLDDLDTVSIYILLSRVCKKITSFKIRLMLQYSCDKLISSLWVPDFSSCWRSILSRSLPQPCLVFPPFWLLKLFLANSEVVIIANLDKFRVVVFILSGGFVRRFCQMQWQKGHLCLMTPQSKYNNWLHWSRMTSQH